MKDPCMPDDCCVPDSSTAAASTKTQVIHALEFPPRKVEMEGADGATIRELITCREGAPNFAMRMFEVAPGGHTPLHTHPYEHEVFILEGEGELRGGLAPRALRPGDAVFVPPDALHQFNNPGRKTLRFLCLIPNPPSPPTPPSLPK